MSLDIKGKSCSVCHAYLFEEDDVVYCPVCGAPHHRECYAKLGHCALEELHGTENQYDKVEAQRNVEIKEETHSNKNRVKCPMCEEVYDDFLNHCPKCQTPNFRVSDGFTPFDLLGGVPKDMDVGKGVTANEAKRFVLSNTQRYIPKFAAANAGKKASWNWMAFLFPCPWFLGRRMYLYGVLSGILMVAFSLLSLPLNNIIYSLGIDMNNTAAAMSELMSLLPQIDTGAVILSAAGGVLTIVLRILCGLFGDFIYSRYAVGEIAEIKANSEDMERDYAKKGGVSVFGAMAGFLGMELLTSFVIMFL